MMNNHAILKIGAVLVLALVFIFVFPSQAAAMPVAMDIAGGHLSH